ncbi:hypothetical protein BB934_30855 (plasmid) [Microvirga ossetica]|uniref:Uncharacterized protein n=1 Tax=Microvirga ossetica TaxID=1882682 RepID=A0A1B2ERQ8_9HYPH|nr:hypothetical protein [Microvirga ossetica]ANY82665.1 hypothetical protein BB934_30855 [Microvirga ossetica]
MADMLVVATFKFSNPVLFFVKVKADNPFLHVPAKRQAPMRPIGAVMEPREGEPHGAVFKKNKEIGWGQNMLWTSFVYQKFFPQLDLQRLARTTAFDLRAEVRLASALGQRTNPLAREGTAAGAVPWLGGGNPLNGTR